FVTLAIGFLAIRLLGQGSLMLVSTVAVTLWFEKRRGTVLGIFTTGTAIVMALVPVGLSLIIEGYGWRVAWLTSAVMIWLVVVPIAIYVLSNHEFLPSALFIAWNIPILALDNVLKPVLMARGVDAPMLVIFVGSIGGFISFGFLGLFFGAVVLVIAYDLLIAWLEDPVAAQARATTSTD
ncbi:MAG: AI-2E family transporter, partial [Proteobacteria bacterium]|nr:AI-2E family transporter [Pseudomonadota bacterium]